MTAVLSQTPADYLQRSAADPKACIWVAASAGTGKTKVLTDRVLNLLLKGSAPERILCLTFTRAAAGEMANRLHKRLSHWATAQEDVLAQELTNLVGHVPCRETIEFARRLFIRVLDAPGGMKIQTFHGFCQSLLKRFPLEAGLAPHFTVMDDQTTQELLLQAQTEILRHTEDPAVLNSLESLSCVFDETAFKEAIKTLISDRQKFHCLKSSSLISLDTAQKLLEGFFEASLSLRDETLIAQACEETAFNHKDLLSAIEALQSGSKADCERGQSITVWLENPHMRGENFEAYCSAFLTKERSIRACLVTKAVTRASPAIKEILDTEADRLHRLCLKLKQLKIARISWALTQLGLKILIRYQELKAQRMFLDYNDLIDYTVTLLAQPDVTPWVLYKLDGGIDHILIDEAQDSNTQQWGVIYRLTEEFFCGLSARPDQRTLFVVGDAKQSIYSFQGADPKVFDSKRRDFSQTVRASQQEWREVILNISFRSTKAILDTVDAVFRQDHVREGIAISGEFVQHRTHRQGHGGLVEIWPLAESEDSPEAHPWTLPTESYAAVRPEAKLAISIAQQIHGWIKNGDILPSKGRRIQPRDIMILMRRRCAFIDELIRALKSLEVPVAGTDRMALAKQLAVMDLMALGRFLLLPEDDLNLAVVLKSPLIGLNEEQLFTLAYGRSQDSLWRRLKSYCGPDVQIAAALAYLETLLGASKHLVPYELFSHILTALGGKKALIGRLGYDALDPLDEFMSLALAYQQTHTANLQGFLAWLAWGDIEIKRDMEESERDEVRIMTVHGAKGLQAPIVFLPDTVQAPQRRDRIVWATLAKGQSLPIWLPQAQDDAPVTKGFKMEAQRHIDQEYLRLLYVAMTRAEDRLYVCGWQNKREADQKNWYTFIRNALETTSQAVEFDFGNEAFAGWTGKGLRFTCPQEIALTPSAPSIPQLKTEPGSSQDWILKKSPQENLNQKLLKPSQGHDAKSLISLILTPQKDPFKRGKLIHSLLEYLPNIPSDQQRVWGQGFLGNNAGASAQENEHTLNMVLDILAHPEFSLIFGPRSKAEVPIIGYFAGHPVIGRIDRLVVTEKEVLIIDYKTNQEPARSLKDVPERYFEQLKVYKAILSDIYPRHAVRCAILWTQIPELMELSLA